MVNTAHVIHEAPKVIHHLPRDAPAGDSILVFIEKPHTVFGDMPLAGLQMYGTYAEALSNAPSVSSARPISSISSSRGHRWPSACARSSGSGSPTPEHHRRLRLQ